MTAVSPWLSVAGAARRGLVSPATVKREIRSGRLRAYRVGGGRRLLRIHTDDLDGWLRSRSTLEEVRP